MNREQAQDNGFQSTQFQSSSFQGDIDELRNKVRQLWGQLSDDEIEHCEDQRDRFLNAVQKKYGIQKEKVDKTLREIERQCGEAA